LFAAVGIAALPAASLLVERIAIAARARTALLSIEVPLILVLFSDLTFRVRTTEQLSNNPFDTAGIVRAAAQAAALFLGMIALISRPTVAGARYRVMTRPFRMYLAYVGIATIGIAMSALPILTAYRVFEVVVAIVVVAGALRHRGPDALARVERAVFWWLVGMVAVCWLNAVAFPGSALLHPRNSPLPWQIQPVYPVIPANTVGFLGVLLAFWAAARLLPPRRDDFPRRGVLMALTALGVVTVIGAQYRTGYAALMLGVVVILATRRRSALVGGFALAALVLVAWGPTVTTVAEPIALRGAHLNQISQLNGRVDWWSLALPVWHTSPIIGRGLLTATRLALQQGGFGDTNTIHSTWIETIVGTGIAGTALLALALLTALRRAARLAVASDMAPLLLLLAILTRSVTGNTIESFRITTLIFLWAALSLRDWVPPRDRPTERLGA
jgi:hypothetical protein